MMRPTSVENRHAIVGPASVDVSRATLAEAAREAFEIAQRREWRSHDPYDLLLAPFGPPVQSRSTFAARVLVQAGKRSGSRLRRVLRVPEHEEPKALADFLHAAVILTAGGETWARRYVGWLGERLRAAAVAGEPGLGWGLAFPYASRFVSAAPGTPNIYTTTSACRALLAQFKLTGEAASLDAVVEGIRFIVDGLGTFEHRGSRWHRYFRGLDTPTVNVQASTAALLADASRLSGDTPLLAMADEAAAAVLSCQRDDGSWFYSDDGRASFVDGFHTGFTLAGLAEYASLRASEDAAGRARDAVDRGYAFFREHLLTPDGLPRAVADGLPGLDGQNVAQCLQTLVVCGGRPRDRGDAYRLWRREVAGRLRQPRSSLLWELGPAVLATAYLYDSSS